MVLVTDTDGEKFTVHDYWLGAVVRDGRVITVPIAALQWKVGDTVECLLSITGKLSPVRFVIAQINITKSES